MRDLALLALGMAGCVPDSLPTSRGGEEPIGAQLRREEPQLRDDVFRDLLDFEGGADGVFVKTDGSAAIDARHAHTGRSSLLLSSTSTYAAVKLSSLLSGQKLPGQWALLGGYFYCTEPGKVTISMSSVSPATAPAKPLRRSVALVPGRWTPVMLDISHEREQVVGGAFTGELVFSFDNPRHGPIWCDDLMVLDNTRIWVEPGESAAGPQGAWTIRQRGFGTQVLVPAKFNLSLATPESAENGWRVDEANAVRARFSSTGKQKAMTVYPDGRQYLDGRLVALAEALSTEALVAQHGHPGTIEIAETMGKVKRDTAGDPNNDGYNEAVGAYQIEAIGARLDLKITPSSATLHSVVLEIWGMAKGTLLVTMEGRLINEVVRTVDDHVLIQLPGELERETAVSITVR